MTLGAVEGMGAPQLQTSWTRAEAAWAARHRGDVYYELTHPAPQAASSTASASDGSTSGPASGFTLYL